MKTHASIRLCVGASIPLIGNTAHLCTSRRRDAVAAHLQRRLSSSDPLSRLEPSKPSVHPKLRHPFPDGNTVFGGLSKSIFDSPGPAEPEQKEEKEHESVQKGKWTKNERSRKQKLPSLHPLCGEHEEVRQACSDSASTVQQTICKVNNAFQPTRPPPPIASASS